MLARPLIDEGSISARNKPEKKTRKVRANGQRKYARVIDKKTHPTFPVSIISFSRQKICTSDSSVPRQYAMLSKVLPAEYPPEFREWSTWRPIGRLAQFNSAPSAA